MPRKYVNIFHQGRQRGKVDSELTTGTKVQSDTDGEMPSYQSALSTERSMALISICTYAHGRDCNYQKRFKEATPRIASTI